MPKNLKFVAETIAANQLNNFMINQIKQYCDDLVKDFNSISDSRKSILEKISKYISQKAILGRQTNLVYICTHNSRRSHFGQVWARVAADYYGITNVKTFSGGTEATAFNVNAINALKRVGFELKQINFETNATYEVIHDVYGEPSVCFSKVYNHSINPTSEFAAIMTCSDAEENCPFIPGVEFRIGTAYDDPKAFDNSHLKDSKYDERCRQIALETMYVFSKL